MWQSDEQKLCIVVTYAFCSGPSYAFCIPYLLGTFKRYKKPLFLAAHTAHIPWRLVLCAGKEGTLSIPCCAYSYPFFEGLFLVLKVPRRFEKSWFLYARFFCKGYLVSLLFLRIGFVSLLGTYRRFEQGLFKSSWYFKRYEKRSMRRKR